MKAPIKELGGWGVRRAKDLQNSVQTDKLFQCQKKASLQLHFQLLEITHDTALRIRGMKKKKKN